MSVDDAASKAVMTARVADLRGWVRRHPQLSFLLLLPIAISIAMAVLRIGIAAVMSLPVALAFYILLNVPVWLAANALTAVAHRLLSPWRPPLWLLCIVGSIAQALLLSPFFRLAFDLAQPFLLDGARMAEKPMPQWSLQYVGVLLSELAPGALAWIAANYIWDRALDIPRFRYAPASPTAASPAGASPAPAAIDAAAIDAAAADAAAMPRETAPVPLDSLAFDAGRTVLESRRPVFLMRSSLPPEAQLLAITAEEHYVRVIADRGSDLIRYRFSEALAELAADPRGMQVHRSWWLRLDAVVQTAEKGRSLELTLRDGTIVPVSLAFREAVLRALGGRAR